MALLKKLESLNLSNIEVNNDMSRIYSEYPVECLPRKFNSRSGKAKYCQFEEIDMSLYQEPPKMVTFHTTEDRVLPWIMTLHTFYYENIGKWSEVEVNWKDVPENWSESNQSRSILIEILDKDSNTLLYNVTLFLTTGTIRAQGNHYPMFVRNHFPILKRLVNTMVTELSNSICIAETVEKQLIDTENTDLMPSSDDRTSADHTPVINSAGTNVPSLVPSPIATNEPNERLQEAMCDALRKLENLQTNCKN